MFATALLFLTKNLRSYRSIAASIITFIFIINLVSIFIIGMSTGLNEQVTNNDNLNILELYPNDSNQSSLTQAQVDEISKIDGVVGAYYTEGIDIAIQIPPGDGTGYSNLSIFKLDSKYLKYKSPLAVSW